MREKKKPERPDLFFGNRATECVYTDVVYDPGE